MPPSRSKTQPSAPVDHEHAEGGGGPQEAASFIAGTLSELAQIASRHGLGTLGYLLDMAQMEANDILLRRRRSGDR